MPQFEAIATSSVLLATQPANVPVSDFGMMADVFGQMVCSPAAQPCPVQPATLTTVVSRPMPTPLMPVPVARPIKGTWVREVGPVQYVLTNSRRSLEYLRHARSPSSGRARC